MGTLRTRQWHDKAVAYAKLKYEKAQDGYYRALADRDKAQRLAVATRAKELAKGSSSD